MGEASNLRSSVGERIHQNGEYYQNIDDFHQLLVWINFQKTITVVNSLILIVAYTILNNYLIPK